MADILLATLNARYAHTSFSLRYLKANLGALEGRAEILERTIQDRPVDVVERILEKDPRIVGLSVYIWNAAPMLEIVRLLKRVSPETVVVLGGPEVSYEVEPQELCRHADYVVTHEGERAFRELCEAVLEGRPTGGPILAGGRLAPESLRLPYRLYSDEDLRHRTLYVEASRGCPFRCQFCLSSLDESVRHLPLDPLLSELELLLARGARHFKFIDRTFNLRLEVSRRILDFFLERYQPGLFLHFEMIPDRFPESLRPLLRRFPAGALQLEVGIQTFDPEVASRIERRQNYRKLEENLRFLRQETGVHVHADLIAGLPGEDLESFGRGFDRLLELGPQEIQVGLLKRLRGTPIAVHDREWTMAYSPAAPYEVLKTRVLSFRDVQRLRRFSRYWDLVGNRGFFQETLPVLLRVDGSPFRSFMRFSDWLFENEQATHRIALLRLTELLFRYLAARGQDAQALAGALFRDYSRDKKRAVPPFLAEHLARPIPLETVPQASIPARQARHLAGSRTENRHPSPG